MDFYMPEIERQLSKTEADIDIDIDAARHGLGLCIVICLS